MNNHTINYVLYIATTADKLWEALISPRGAEKELGQYSVGVDKWLKSDGG